MQTVNISQGTDEWKAWRSQGVTASDAIALAGGDDRTWWHLWAEKSGLVEPPDLDRNPMVQRGHWLEDPARRVLERRLGSVLLPVCAEADDAPFMRASFDGLDDSGRPGELKAPGNTVAEHVYAEGEQSEAYRRYWYQLQHQLIVAGAGRGFLAFYNPWFGGDGLMLFEINADAAFQSELLDRSRRFMALLNGGRAPAKDPERDPFHPAGANDRRWAEVARRYAELEERAKGIRDELKLIQQEQRELAADCREMMGEFRKADAHGLRITRSTKRGSVDYASLLRDHAIGDDVVEGYRRAPSECTTITVQFDRVPEAPEAAGGQRTVTGSTASGSDDTSGVEPSGTATAPLAQDFYF